MFFAGLTSAYVVSMSGGYWTRINMPAAFYWSTAFVLAGSLTIHWRLLSVRQGTGGHAPASWPHLASGIAFTVRSSRVGADLVRWASR
jgi:hypothetical protein